MTTRKISMICADLDGTLFDDVKMLTRNTRNILEKAMEQGIVFLPSTGRPYCAIPPCISRLNGLKYLMTSNGSEIFDLNKKNPIHMATMTPALALEALDRMKGYDVWQEVCIEGVSYVEEKYFRQAIFYVPQENSRSYLLETRTTTKDIRALIKKNPNSICKVCFFFPSTEMRDKARAQFGFMENVSALAATSRNFEVSAESATKAHSMVYMAELLHIPLEEIIAFGDGENDADMIRTAGIGVAMENACIEARLAADILAPDNNNEGVYQVLKKYIQ